MMDQVDNAETNLMHDFSASLIYEALDFLDTEGRKLNRRKLLLKKDLAKAYNIADRKMKQILEDHDPEGTES
jgi:hypothetical protein